MLGPTCVLLVTALAGSEVRARSVAIEPEVLGVGKGEDFSHPTFVQADRRGAVSFLTGKELRTVPLLPNGKLGEGGELGAGGGISLEPPLRAVMSRGGDWLLLSPPKVHLVRNGKRQTLNQPEWGADHHLGFLRDEPVIGVKPLRTAPSKHGWTTKDVPLILRWSGRDWQPLVTESLPKGTTPRNVFTEKVVRPRSVHLLGDSRGTLWAANEVLYRVRRFSSSGRLLTEITVGPQKPRPSERAPELQEKFAANFKDWQAPRGGRLVLQAAVLRRVIEAVAEGRDGKLYLLVHEPWAGGGFALDRFDPATQILERARVALHDSGWLTMAAGKDGLYLTPWNPSAGPWKMSWASIENATWERVRGVCHRSS